MITVRVDRSDDRFALLRVGGDIDIATAGALDDALADACAAAAAVVVDLSAVRFCAAAGVHCLHRVIETGSVQLVCRTPGPVSTILRLLGLDVQWPVHRELGDAVAHCTRT